MTIPKTEPRTAAGRAMLDMWDEHRWDFPYPEDRILAIEAEAAERSAPLDAETLALAMERDGWEFEGDPVFGAHSILDRIPEYARLTAQSATPQPATPAAHPAGSADTALRELALDVTDYCNDPKLVEQARAALAAQPTSAEDSE